MYESIMIDAEQGNEWTHNYMKNLRTLFSVLRFPTSMIVAVVPLTFVLTTLQTPLSVTSEITRSVRLLNILYTRRITGRLQILNITFVLHENRASGNSFQGRVQ